VAVSVVTDEIEPVLPFALDWGRWRRHRRSSETTRKGFEKRRFPARSWEALLPAKKTPWPFSEDEARVIADAFPERFREVGLEKSVQATRLWIRRQMTRGTKWNPRKEILQLRDGLVCLFEALMKLSPDARQHLQRWMRPGQEGQEPFTIDQLQYAIDCFDHEKTEWG
jgi:hypothetical protein